MESSILPLLVAAFLAVQGMPKVLGEVPSSATNGSTVTNGSTAVLETPYGAAANCSTLEDIMQEVHPLVKIRLVIILLLHLCSY